LLVCPPWRQLDPDDWHLISPLVSDCWHMPALLASVRPPTMVKEVRILWQKVVEPT
jgi:hypothetical protein